MKESEFKNWFQGFSEGMGDNPPNAKQWDRIKEMVENIDGKAVTEVVFRDWYYGRPWYHNQLYYGHGTIGSGGLVLNGYNAVSDNQATWTAEASGMSFDVNHVTEQAQKRAIGADGGMAEFAMYAAGRAEALEIG